MLNTLEIFRMAQGLATHAADRHSTIAANIANADTPGYRAKDVVSFAETYDDGSSQTAMRATRPGHLNGQSDGSDGLRLVDAGGESSPNGNTVSLETEMVKSTEAMQQHNMALSVYSASLNILRTSLGRGR